MDRDKALKANELIEEIDELKKCKKSSRDGNHFRFVEHYGNDALTVNISKKHTDKFTVVLDKIINELEQELLDL